MAGWHALRHSWRMHSCRNIAQDNQSTRYFVSPGGRGGAESRSRRREGGLGSPEVGARLTTLATSARGTPKGPTRRALGGGSLARRRCLSWRLVKRPPFSPRPVERPAGTVEFAHAEA